MDLLFVIFMICVAAVVCGIAVLCMWCARHEHLQGDWLDQVIGVVGIIVFTGLILCMVRVVVFVIQSYLAHDGC